MLDPAAVGSFNRHHISKVLALGGVQVVGLGVPVVLGVDSHAVVAIFGVVSAATGLQICILMMYWQGPIQSRRFRCVASAVAGTHVPRALASLRYLIVLGCTVLVPALVVSLALMSSHL